MRCAPAAVPPANHPVYRARRVHRELTQQVQCRDTMLWKSKKSICFAAIALTLQACASDPTTDVARGATLGPDPEAFATIMRVADATAASGDWVSAIGMYRRATELWPTDLEARVRLAIALANAKALNEAVDAFQTALKLNPNHLDARRGLANALIALDQPQLAVPHLEAALKLQPGDVRTYNSIGVVHDMLGQHRTAQGRYREGLAMDPNNIALINNLGLSLAITGDFDEAVAVLRPVAASPGANVRTRQNLALVYGLAGQPENAARIARVDLDENSVKKNLSYYGMLRQMHDRSKGAAIGAMPSGMPAYPLSPVQTYADPPGPPKVTP